MSYKKSKYNIPIHLTDDQCIVWNSKSGSITKFEKEIWEAVDSEDFKHFKVLEILSSLYNEGFVVNKDKNEYNEILVKRKIEQYNHSKQQFFVIAPTLNCNFNCSYCFEKQNMCLSTMNPNTVCSSVEFIENQLINNGSDCLHISWFGGEPLLAFNDVILPMSKSIVSICEKYKIKFDSDIITNAYYLTEEKFDDIFKLLKTNKIQITFDGTSEYYCKAKKTTQYSYDKVKSNMFLLAKYIYENNIECHIDIRLNIDNENFENIKQFFEEIKNDKRYLGNLNFYLGRLQGADSRFLSLKEFEEKELSFDSFINSESCKFLEPKCVWCRQHTINAFCIGPNGELYKCERDFGNSDHVIGDVFYGLSYNNYFCKFMDISLNEKCKECVLLPVCIGGCPNISVDSGFDCISTLNHAILMAKKSIGI